MLKGTTKIELTDVHTGEKQVIEKHNMITGALGEIFQPRLGHLTTESTLRGYTPVYTNLLGGLFLFNQQIPENANQIFAPAGTVMTGCARYNYVNSGSSTVLGSYNVNESRFDEANRQMKFVYDFNTSQGNGTIAAVSLTHIDAGYGSYGANVSYNTQLAKTCYGTPKDLLVGSKDTQNNITLGNYAYLFLLDVDNDYGYYLTATDNTHLTITKRRLGLKNFSLFSNKLDIIETYELPAITTALSSYSTYNFDLADNALYVCSSANTIAVNGSFTVTKITFGDWRVTQHTVTNTGDQSLYGSGRFCLVHQGFAYMRSNASPYIAYAIQITNSANIKKFTGSTATDTIEPIYALNGKMFYQFIRYSSGLGTSLYVADKELENFRMSGNQYITYCGTSGTYYRNPTFTPIKGHPMLVYTSAGSTTNNSGFFFLGHYLATINNLTEAVVKTADKTMKITYIIEET